MTVVYVSKDEQHDPGGELEPRKWCSGPSGDPGHYTPVSEFGAAANRADGLRSVCRACEREMSRRRMRDENGYTKRDRKTLERLDLVRPLAEQGFSAPEIAEKLNHAYATHTIQKDIRRMGLNPAAQGRRGAAPVSVLKRIEAASIALAGIANQLDQLQLSEVTFPEEAAGWEKELTKVSYSINRVRRQLKKGRNPE
jgi:hypothetical protein